MRSISFLNLIIYYLILFIWNINKPVYSSVTILNCTGNIPKKIACIIKANSYDVSIKRIDICQKDPFPNYRSTPDYNRSICINLFSSGLSNTNILDKEKKFYITKNLNIEKGKYKYISLILKNKFTVSGQYKADGYFWSTSKKGPKEIIQSKNNISITNKFTTKLTNWRGKKNIDNKYCQNNGGTPSRCDLQYNGFKMTGIGLDSDLIETTGGKIDYLFFISELSPVINLNKNSEGYFNIILEKNLEVFGNGSAVESISIAPFNFKTRYISEEK